MSTPFARRAALALALAGIGFAAQAQDVIDRESFLVEVKGGKQVVVATLLPLAAIK